MKDSNFGKTADYQECQTGGHEWKLGDEGSPNLQRDIQWDRKGGDEMGFPAYCVNCGEEGWEIWKRTGEFEEEKKEPNTKALNSLGEDSG